MGGGGSYTTYIGIIIDTQPAPVDLPDDRALLRAAQVPFGGRLVRGRAFFPISICQCLRRDIHHGHPRALAAGLAVAPSLRADGRAGDASRVLLFCEVVSFSVWGLTFMVIEDLAPRVARF